MPYDEGRDHNAPWKIRLREKEEAMGEQMVDTWETWFRQSTGISLARRGDGTLIDMRARASWQAFQYATERAAGIVASRRQSHDAQQTGRIDIALQDAEREIRGVVGSDQGGPAFIQRVLAEFPKEGHCSICGLEQGLCTCAEDDA